MNVSRWLIVATVVGVAVAGSACTQRVADDTTPGSDIALDTVSEGAGTAADATRDAAEAVADVTKDIAQKTADTTRDIAGAVGSTTKTVVSKTGEATTDAWITTTVNAGFVDEVLLKGSDVNVDTKDHVVTLKGTVGSDAARARAVAVARGTAGVTRVVDQLVVKVG